MQPIEGVVTQEIIDKLTLWACLQQVGFTTGQLADQVSRTPVEEKHVLLVARRLVRAWKGKSKILFVRGAWRWNPAK